MKQAARQAKLGGQQARELGRDSITELRFRLLLSWLICQGLGSLFARGGPSSSTLTPSMLSGSLRDKFQRHNDVNHGLCSSGSILLL